jgi:hypothetical protein
MTAPYVRDIIKKIIEKGCIIRIDNLAPNMIMNITSESQSFKPVSCKDVLSFIILLSLLFHKKWHKRRLIMFSWFFGKFYMN